MDYGLKIAKKTQLSGTYKSSTRIFGIPEPRILQKII